MSDALEKTRFRRGLRSTQTEAETRLWHRLRDRRLAGFKFVRQESIGRYVADFCCREVRLIIEVDGGQHTESEHDRLRDDWLASQGYRVLRFWNAEVMTNTVGVLDTILSSLPPSPRLRGEGRAPLAGGEASPKGDGEGAGREASPASPPHHRLPPRFADDKVGKTLSPQAGRGDALSIASRDEGLFAALPPSPRLRGEGRAPLVGGEASPKGEGEGATSVELHPKSPPHPRLPPRCDDDGVVASLSPQAGRGEKTQ